MHSVFLLGAVGALIAAPGGAAALLAYRPGELGILTRCAAVFGSGFAVAGGSAFLLAIAHIFWLTTYLPLWLGITVGLWLQVLRRVPVREHARAIASEFGDNRVPLLIGAVIVLTLLVVRGAFLHVLPGPRYVYFLNGLEIANSHGIPGTVLEYGQAWPPATDKVFLDAFTGVAVLFFNNPLVVPGVMLWIAYAGAAIGLWALAWELGLRRTGVLLPVLMLANTLLPGKAMAAGFDFYRAEDFGMAIAFCAGALGVVAIRNGGRRSVVFAGVVLAIASGSHLIPVVIVVMILASVVVAELLRRARTRPRKATLRTSVALGATSAVTGLVIRLLAGGSFGLGGAGNQSSYAVVPTPFDPTAFLYGGSFLSRHPADLNHFYTQPDAVLRRIMLGATDIPMILDVVIVILVVALVVGLAFALTRTGMGAAALAGVGVLFGISATALYFSYHYHVWVEATFGTRRLTPYAPIGVILLVLVMIEGLLLLIGSRRWRFANRAAMSLGAALVVSFAVWLVPTVGVTRVERQAAITQRVFATWARIHTPCGARFLLDQRSEGSVASLTGRFALDEGMGAFLRPNRLPQVARVLLATRAFYQRPRRNEAMLVRYGINYVVLAHTMTLGYGGPIPTGKSWRLDAAPFLTPVFQTRWVSVYRVEGSEIQPVSPLLKGPYLHCRRGRVSY